MKTMRWIDLECKNGVMEEHNINAESEDMTSEEERIVGDRDQVCDIIRTQEQCCKIW